MKSILFLLIFVVANTYALDTLKIIAPSGGEVNIYRDDFGVPHIYADNEADLFFGQGFSTAQDRLIQLHMIRINSAGRLAENSFLFDADVQQLISEDVNARLTQYTSDELAEHFSKMNSGMQKMINSYTDGINRYIDSMNISPIKYMDYYYNQLKQFGIKIPEWTNINTMEVIVYMSRIFGQFGGEELKNYQLMLQMGEESFDANYPINDPDVYATLQSDEQGAVEQTYKSPNMDIPPDFASFIEQRKSKTREFREKNNIPNKFGSFAALISPDKSFNNSGMLLGCPQMGTPESDEVTILNEVELHSPTLHAGGAAVTGIPGIIIGRTENFAWTFTSGVMDNTDAVMLTLNEELDKYQFNDELLDFEIIYDTIYSLDVNFNKIPHPVEFKRSHHGPVLQIDSSGQMAVAYQYTFWQNEFKTWESLYNLLKSETDEEVMEAISECTISFNMLYMNKEKEAKYHFLGLYPKRNFGVDPRFPRMGDGTEEWQEFWAFDDLPHGDFSDQDYFINWNNKPASWWDQGDNLYWIEGNNIDDGAKVLNSYVVPFTDMTYQDLKDIPKAVQDHGTYQQAFAFLDNGDIIDENILPPGQSAFTYFNGTSSEHSYDQWDLFVNWQYKDMIFGDEIFVSVDYDYTTEKSVKLMPNPAISSVRILYNAESSGLVKVVIRDISGKPIIQIYEGNAQKGDNEFIWNIDNSISPGVYFYTIIQNNRKFTGKIMIQ